MAKPCNKTEGLWLWWRNNHRKVQVASGFRRVAKGFMNRARRQHSKQVIKEHLED